MKSLKPIAVLGALLLGTAAVPAFAQSVCSDLEFAADVTKQFPEIEKACREVVSRDGQQFVQVRADVLKVTRNVKDPSDVRRVTLKMLDAEDAPLRNLAFRPPRDFTFTVDGEPQTADDMGRGQELRIYIPPDRWEMVWDLETAVPFDERIYIEDVEALSTMVMLEADKTFAFDSAELSEGGQEQLQAVLDEIGDYVPMIDVIGYTDRIGDEDYNQSLSERRAEAAKAYLVTLGVPEQRVRSMGKGAADPIVACPGKEGEELKDCLGPNRRAEVRFMVPLVAEGGFAVVNKQYRKPNGEIVSVVEFDDVVSVSPASSLYAPIVDACAADVQSLCPDVPAGEGRILLCLYQNSMALDPSCTDAMAAAQLKLKRRERQINLIAEVCSGDLATHCSAVPLSDKLSCLRASELTPVCGSAVANFQGLGD